MKLRTFITFAMLSALMSLGASKPKASRNSATHSKLEGDFCTVDGITSGCSLFDPAQGDAIRLPDGTIIPNFSAIYRVTEQRNLSEEFLKRTAKTAQKTDSILKIKASFNDVLKEVDDKVMHPEFKLYFSDHLLAVLKILFASSDADFGLRFPWPIYRPKGLAGVKADVIRGTLRAIFNPFQMDRLKKIFEQAEEVSDPNRETESATLRDMGKVTPERRKYIRKLVEFAKEAVANVVMQGKKADRLSDAEKNAVLKVRTVAFRDAFDEIYGSVVRASPRCREAIPNAFYNPSDHSFALCPRMYNFPDSTIVSVVAHEIAHSIDPCNSQFGTYTVNWKAFDEIRGKTQTRKMASIAEDNQRFVVFLMLEKMRELQQGDTTAAQFPLVASEDAARFFENAGVLNPQAQGTRFEDYVFKDIYLCLRNRIGFRASQEEEVRSLAREVVELRRSVRDADYDAKKDEDRIVRALGKFPECRSLDKNSQMGEATSDWIAARVLGQFLKGMQLESYLERLGPIAFNGNLLCMERMMIHEDQDQTLSGVLRAAWRDTQRLRDAHPVSRDRIDKIFLADREVREALGCPATTVEFCEHKSER